MLKYLGGQVTHDKPGKGDVGPQTLGALHADICAVQRQWRCMRKHSMRGSPAGAYCMHACGPRREK
jgi:hypothetical protein